MMFLLYCWCISILFITGVQGPRNCHCHCHCQICVRIPVRQQWTALERQSLQHQQQSPWSYLGLWLRLRTCIRNIFWKNDCSSPILLTFMKSIVTVTVNAFQDCIHLLRDGYWRWKPSEEKNFLVFQTLDCDVWIHMLEFKSERRLIFSHLTTLLDCRVLFHEAALDRSLTYLPKAFASFGKQYALKSDFGIRSTPPCPPSPLLENSPIFQEFQWDC